MTPSAALNDTAAVCVTPPHAVGTACVRLVNGTLNATAPCYARFAYYGVCVCVYERGCARACVNVCPLLTAIVVCQVVSCSALTRT